MQAIPNWPSGQRLPHLLCDRDRHGKARWYYRNRGVAGSPQIRLRAAFGSVAFVAEYEAAEASVLAGTAAKMMRPEKPPRPNATQRRDDVRSLGWLLARYFASTEFTDGLGEATRYEARRILDKTCNRPFPSAALGKVTIGQLPYADMHKGAVMDLRDDLKATPSMANHLLKSVLSTGQSIARCRGSPSTPAWA